MVRPTQYTQNGPAPEVTFPNEDWLLSHKAMRSYLQYRLHVVEHQIERLMRELERHDGPPFPADLNDQAYPDRSWASWANLNYLLRARDSLQSALSRPSRKLN